MLLHWNLYFVIASLLSQRLIPCLLEYKKLLWSLFAWKIFFQPFTFSLYVSPVLRWVSCRQHMQAAFFTVQLSHPYMTTWKTIALTRRTFIGKGISLLFNMQSRLVITFLLRSKRLLISWLQSPSAVSCLLFSRYWGIYLVRSFRYHEKCNNLSKQKG